MTGRIYFGAVAYDTGDYEREDFAYPEDRERWIERRLEGKVYEGAKVVSVARSEAEWVDVAATVSPVSPK